MQKIKEKMIVSVVILIFIVLSIQLPDRIERLKNYMMMKQVITQLSNF